MNTTNRIYETMYIVDATLTDEQIDPIIEKYSKLVTDQGGEVMAAGKWDKRRLAYEVKGHREGTYVLMFFASEAAVPKELDRVMRIAEDVFRHLITRVEPQHVDTSRIDHPQVSAEAAAPVQVAVAEAVEAAPEVAEPIAEPAVERIEEVEAPAEVEAEAAEVEAEPVEAPAEETSDEEPKTQE